MSDARARELAAKGWAGELDGGELGLTAEGARELLALTDAGALDLVRRRIEGEL